VRSFQPEPQGDAERWPSGRRRTPGKCVGGEPSQGFESLSLRQFLPIQWFQKLSLPKNFRCLYTCMMHVSFSAEEITAIISCPVFRARVAASPLFAGSDSRFTAAQLHRR